jgi:anhydro-N-acetylmuramic acid kinase
MEEKTYRAVGLMSGSSLDGLDIAYCEFSETNSNWSFKLLDSYCLLYTPEFQETLKNLTALSAKELMKTDVYLGLFFGKAVKDFISARNITAIDVVASHGHTVFHYPERGFTTQLGAGASIAASCGYTVVSDLRTMDIAQGGKGAPIVPIGDKLLFREHVICLNLGGIANLSAKINDTIVAFDFCGANQLLNYLALQLGLEYDKNGAEAAKGNIGTALLEALNSVPFHSAQFPKSLDNTFVQQTYFPILDNSTISIQDKLNTITEFIAIQFANHIAAIEQQLNISLQGKSALITGGGAFNTFLIKRIKALSHLSISVPSPEIIVFKEAIVMAFIGVLRLRNEPNVLASVTGAAKDTINGAVYLP